MSKYVQFTLIPLIQKNILQNANLKQIQLDYSNTGSLLLKYLIPLK